MWACWRPQNCEHWPRNRPGAFACRHISLVWPGIWSILVWSWGTQKEWITSAVVSSRRTGSPTGMCNSLAVSAPFGYRASHHHRWPMTPTVRRDLFRGLARALIPGSGGEHADGDPVPLLALAPDLEPVH